MTASKKKEDDKHHENLRIGLDWPLSHDWNRDGADAGRFHFNYRHHQAFHHQGEEAQEAHRPGHHSGPGRVHRCSNQVACGVRPSGLLPGFRPAKPAFAGEHSNGGGLNPPPSVGYTAAMTGRLLALAVAITLAANSQSVEAVRKEIEASYAKALDALRNAKSMEDLDEMNRSLDTVDWQSIVPGKSPRGWQELRKYGFVGLWAPFQSSQLTIDTFSVNGDTAVLTGHLRQVGMKGNVSLIPLKETWKKTIMGWKRQIHQKFPPGETPK